MKKITSVIILTLFCFAAKAQSRILISYDDNGNRIQRYYVAQRPVNEADSSNNNKPLADNTDSTWQSKIPEAVAFKVYPNPSSNNFNVAIDATMLKNKCEIILTDQLGKIYLKKTALGAITTISTQQLADGIYYVILYYSGQKSTVKLVKVSGY